MNNQELIKDINKDLVESKISRYDLKYEELYNLKQNIIKENISYSIAKAFYDDINKKWPFIL